MNLRIVVLLILCFFANKVYTQSNEIINPKGNWFFGAEVGLNAITSVHKSRMTAIQGGLLSEYYFAEQWSLTARLKYFETGVTRGRNIENGFFEGAVLAVPININWHYRIHNNFSGNLKMGFALNQEISSMYYYPPDAKTDYSKFYGSFNPGLGFNYFISDQTAVYINYEVYILGNERDDYNSYGIIPNSPNNNLLNIGLKYNFIKMN
jgi:hypothetical protein